MEIVKTEEIQIVVNGAGRCVPGDLTLTGLLGFLEISEERVAIELNGSIVRKGDWAATSIGAGANLEIVQFVGGG